MAKAKSYASYDQVPEKYRFDLNDILQGKSYKYWFNKFVFLFEKRIEIKDSKFKSIENFLKDIKLYEQLIIVEYKLHNYISNNHNIEVTSEKFSKLKNDFNFKNNELNQKFGSENNRYFKYKDKLEKWIQDPRLSNLKHYFESILDEFKYKLSDEVEEYIIKSSYGKQSASETFSILTNSEIKFKDVIDLKGKKHKLNNATRSTLLKSDDKQVRKQTYENYAKGYIKNKNTLTSLLFDHFKEIVTEAKIRKFDSAIDFLIYNDRMNKEALLKLFEQVIKGNKNVISKYKKAYKQFYRARFGEKMELYDGARDLVTIKTNYSVEEAKEIVYKALLPFGNEYSNKIKEAFDKRWVDYMVVENKRSGAYSIGASYGIDKKYILMNFDGTLRSVETLAHELGHSMHSYYSDTRQNLFNSNYPIFLAEIASIYNELMLSDYLLTNSKDKKTKFYILQNIINGFIGTVLRQVEWANYEYDLYTAIEEGKASKSFNYISELYYQNALKYTHEKNLKKTDVLSYGSIMVPHYYYYFYVYKYAIGQLVAIYFYRQYKENKQVAIKSYINNFLSQGGSDYPLEILKKVGIDLNSDHFYEEGFKFIEDIINQWIKLGKEIFKNNKFNKIKKNKILK